MAQSFLPSHGIRLCHHLLQLIMHDCVHNRQVWSLGDSLIKYRSASWPPSRVHHEARTSASAKFPVWNSIQRPPQSYPPKSLHHIIRSLALAAGGLAPSVPPGPRRLRRLFRELIRRRRNRFRISLNVAAMLPCVGLKDTFHETPHLSLGGSLDGLTPPLTKVNDIIRWSSASC
jgi:hypothetical protein